MAAAATPAPLLQQQHSSHTQQQQSVMAASTAAGGRKSRTRSESGPARRSRSASARRAASWRFSPPSLWASACWRCRSSSHRWNRAASGDCCSQARHLGRGKAGGKAGRDSMAGKRLKSVWALRGKQRCSRCEQWLPYAGRQPIVEIHNATHGPTAAEPAEACACQKLLDATTLAVQPLAPIPPPFLPSHHICPQATSLLPPAAVDGGCAAAPPGLAPAPQPAAAAAPAGPAGCCAAASLAAALQERSRRGEARGFSK